jgi:3-dehydroquinate dehydratase
VLINEDTMMKRILMLHGVNHNMFGKRDPVQYGTITLAEIDERMQALGKELGVEVTSYQTTPARGRTTATRCATRSRS